MYYKVTNEWLMFLKIFRVAGKRLRPPMMQVK